jgi:26S proteasome regulatory subunit N1
MEPGSPTPSSIFVIAFLTHAQIHSTVVVCVGKYAEITLETCAYAGTGNVLKVQSMLRTCAEHLTENADHQAAAVLGIALIVWGEDVGTEMSMRTFDHLLHYGELPVKRVVPLALSLLYVSNPDYAVSVAVVPTHEL